jgi:hypothetical protein
LEKMGGMSWRYLAFRYAWAITDYHLLRSSRWSDEKAMTLFVLGALMSWPVVAAQVLWLLTGRGPIQWIFRPNIAFVNPFPRWEVPEGAIQRALAARKDKYRDVPIVPPRRGRSL